MIEPKDFYQSLNENGIEFFTGVPDSLLKHICAYISDNTGSDNHIIAANEGNAIAIAMGYHMATQKIPMVYMQNSGLGNAINPLLSLADKEVYSIPMLILVGWRGKPGISDEPQHIKQGRIHKKLISAMELPDFQLNKGSNFKKVISEARKTAEIKSCPVMISVEKACFNNYKIKKIVHTEFELSREEAIKEIAKMIDNKDIIVATTGKTSRELFEFRKSINSGHQRDFLTVGGMGHANQIALGVALSKKDRIVYCLDGDGALLMHAGSMGIIGDRSPKNFKHIVLNNGSHDSVGGQPTISFNIDYKKIVKGFKYNKVLKAKSKEELKKKFNELKLSNGPSLLEVRVNKGSRNDLGRPTISPKNNKKDFIKNLT